MALDSSQLSRETLVGMLEDFAKNWLAHDGLWFQAVERALGTEVAIKLDAEAWAQFSRIEAERIMSRHQISRDGGLDAVKQALKYRLYAVLNTQIIEQENTNSFVFKMLDCRVQSARCRKKLPAFPCKSVGLVEYTEFAKAIDPRVGVECLACPPDHGERDYCCGWRFRIG